MIFNGIIAGKKINLISKTVTSNNTIQIVTPNDTEVCGLTNISVDVDSTSKKGTTTVSLPIVSGNTYRVEGNGTVSRPNSSSSVDREFTINGEWECGTTLPFTETIPSGSSAQWLVDLALTPTKLSAECYVAVSHIVSIAELHIYSSEGTTYDGLSSVTVLPAPQALTLLYSDEKTINTTSTSEALVESISLTDDQKSDIVATRPIIYTRIRDKAGIRSEHFYGSDNFSFINKTGSSSSTDYSTTTCTIYYRALADGANNVWAGGGNSTSYGIYAKIGTGSAGFSLKVYSKYSSTYTKTISGTFTIEVYKLYGPDGNGMF